MPDDTSTLELPPLELRVKQTIGEIRHVLKARRTASIVREGEEKISPRCKERAVDLDSGERIVITQRKKVNRPSGVDGILRIDEDTGISTWLSHKQLEQFEASTSAGHWTTLKTDISATWKEHFSYRQEELDDDGNVVSNGLRPPQIGALHAIASHWSLSDAPGTVVMPTGTGKTETMLATMLALAPSASIHLKGSATTLNHLRRASRFKEVRASIVIVQPGIFVDRLSEAQGTVLACTQSFLLDTVNIHLDVVGSHSGADEA